MSQNPIIVTVSGDTVDEIREKLLKLAKDFGHDDSQGSLPLSSPAPSNVGSGEQTPQGQAALAAKEEKRGRGRPPKTETASQPDSAAEGSTAPPAQAPPVNSGKEQMVEALQELQSVCTLKAVITTLAKFGAKKASEAKESDYKAIIEDCKNQIAEAKKTA